MDGNYSNQIKKNIEYDKPRGTPVKLEGRGFILDRSRALTPRSYAESAKRQFLLCNLGLNSGQCVAGPSLDPRSYAESAKNAVFVAQALSKLRLMRNRAKP